jgi:NAD-reducing hydrogenase large subunit
VQSHALSFFHLSAPDLLLGLDSDPAKRNILGVLEQHPELARDGIALRKFGQTAIERLAGERIHPSWIVPGGVNAPLSAAARDAILGELPIARSIVRRTLQMFKGVLDGFEAEIDSFDNEPTLYAGLVTRDDTLNWYDGQVAFVDEKGAPLARFEEPGDYTQYIGEAAVPFSYLKAPYYAPRGYPAGLYRVGPLARLNVAASCGTPLADAELAEYRERAGHPAQSAFYYHYARLIEALRGVEKMEILLEHPDILSTHVRARAQVNALEGVGIIEAPRGLLIHHYQVDESGAITKANLIVATGHNNLAMNHAVTQVAKRFVKGDKIEEGALNRVSAVIRAFDPCLSCSTHVLGQPDVQLQLYSSTGALLDELVN